MPCQQQTLEIEYSCSIHCLHTVQSFILGCGQKYSKKSDPFDIFDNANSLVLVKWCHLHKCTPNSCWKPPQIIIIIIIYQCLKVCFFLSSFSPQQWHRRFGLGPDDWSTSRSAVREHYRRSLTSWWLNHPFEEYARQIGSSPQGSGWKFQKYLKPPRWWIWDPSFSPFFLK